MRARSAIAVVTTLAGIVLVSACADEEILLARLPPTKDAGIAIEPKRCVDADDCPNSAFCARIACRDEGGICTARPTLCEDEGSAVCGCDGITYWNDCLRRAAGITAQTPRPCMPDVAQTCGGMGQHGPGPGPASERCPAGTFCARLLPPSPPGAPNECPPDVPGTCWAALPPVCPVEAGPDRWSGCGALDPVCRTTCDAIHTGKPHRLAKACP
jgi:hypothetical protein